MATAKVIPLFRAMPLRQAIATPLPQIPQPVIAIVQGSGDSAAAREMVSAAMSSWMEGEPLTAREQRLVDLVLDTNYFGQIGRLALGA